MEGKKSVNFKKKPDTTRSNHSSDGLDGHSNILLITFRCLVILVIFLVYKNSSQTQQGINKLWEYLLASRIYNSVYFETLFTTTCYGIIIAAYPFVLHHVKPFDKYKVDPSVTYKHQTVLGMVFNAMRYMTPFATLDTFLVKRYVGVSQEIFDEKSKHWIQTARALPILPPTFAQVIFHLIGSILLFDAIFFFVHLTLHRNIWLYKTFHRYHHDHDVLHPHVTDQLTTGERVILVLAANFALKCFYSHPLTRTIFIPVFVFLLVENHTGYDLPFGVHRIIPYGILSGPVKHYKHHVNGERNYQPFLNYMDYLFQRWSKL